MRRTARILYALVVVAFLAAFVASRTAAFALRAGHLQIGWGGAGVCVCVWESSQWRLAWQSPVPKDFQWKVLPEFHAERGARWVWLFWPLPWLVTGVVGAPLLWLTRKPKTKPRAFPVDTPT